MILHHIRHTVQSLCHLTKRKANAEAKELMDILRFFAKLAHRFGILAKCCIIEFFWHLASLMFSPQPIFYRRERGDHREKITLSVLCVLCGEQSMRGGQLSIVNLNSLPVPRTISCFRRISPRLPRASSGSGASYSPPVSPSFALLGNPTRKPHLLALAEDAHPGL